jgi:hypothetical protein
MSASPEVKGADPNNPTAHEAVRAFMDMARRHFGDEALSIALVSTGAGLMASAYGTEPAVTAMKRAIRELRRMETE